MMHNYLGILTQRQKLNVNPSDEFIRFIIKDFSQSRVTSNVIDRFRPLVKKVISNAVLDIVSKGLYHEEAINTAIKNNVDDNCLELNDDLNKKTDVTVKSKEPTPEELKCFELVRKVLEKMIEIFHK